MLSARSRKVPMRDEAKGFIAHHGAGDDAAREVRAVLHPLEEFADRPRLHAVAAAERAARAKWS